MAALLLSHLHMLRFFVTLGSGEAAARLLYMLAFLWMARALGKEALGQFGLLLTVSSYLILFVQQGFDQLAIREVAKSRDAIRRYAEAMVGLRLTVAAVLFAGAAVYAAWAGLYTIASGLLLVFSLRLFITAITLQWSFVALGQARYLALFSILSSAVFFLGVAFLKRPEQVVWAAGAQVAGELIGALFLWNSWRRQFGRLRPRVDPVFWLELIRRSWPISGSVLLGTFLYSFDVLVLGWVSSRGQIGLYLACYRCITVFSPFLLLVHSTSFPHFSRAYPDTREAKRLALRVGTPMLAVALACSIALSLGSGPLLQLFFGDGYREGALVLKVLAWVLPIQAIRVICRQILVAFHLETRDTIAMGLAVFTNITLDFVLAPYWGALGCAFSTVASEVVLLTSLYIMARRCLRAPHAEPLPAPVADRVMV